MNTAIAVAYQVEVINMPEVMKIITLMALIQKKQK